MDETKTNPETPETEEKGLKKFKKKEKNLVPKEEYDAMQERFTKALSTAAYYENQCKYYKGEYDRSLKYRSQSLVEDLLPVLDGFQLAFKMEPPTKEAKDYRIGFEYVYTLLKNTLESEGVSPVTPKVGDLFNSKLEQVVDIIETSDEGKDNHIAESLLNGYMLKDRLIRPASVKVYKLKKAEDKVEKKETASKASN